MSLSHIPDESVQQRQYVDRFRKRKRFTLRGVFLALTVLAGLFSAAYYVKQSAENARRISASYPFHQVAADLHHFNDGYRCLPHPIWRSGGQAFPRDYNPVGTPLSSWRFALTPWTASYPIREYHGDKPWDHFDNGWFATCWYWWEFFGYGESPDTIMFAITGPGTAFGDGKVELPRRLQEIESDTILVVETRNSGVHWMEPGDFDIRTMPRTINAADGRGISSRYRFGFHVIFADGEVWALSHDTPFADLEKFFTVKGARIHDRNDVLGPYRAH